jgi:hypothetical protein
MTSESKCPSAQPASPGAEVIGIVHRLDREQVVVAFLRHRVEIEHVLSMLPASVSPTEVFRFGARCAESNCRHFSSDRCTLVSRIVAELPQVTDHLPPCRLRSSCRWWQQEGAAACCRCPQIATESFIANKKMKALSVPQPSQVPATPEKNCNE